MSTQRNEIITVTQPNIDPAAIQAFLAQLAAQQAAQPTVPGGALPVQAAAPLVPAVAVSVSDAVAEANRPRGHGPNLFSDKNKIPNTTIPYTVAGPTGAKQETNFTTKQPEFYPDGRAKVELVIPLDVPVTELHPEGRATLYSKGLLTQKISQAMVAAGCTKEVLDKGLEVGATGTITYLGKVTRQGKTGTYTQNDWAVTYVRPGQAPTPAPAAVQAPAPVAPVAVTPAVTQPVPALPAGGVQLSPEQLMALLTANQPPAAA